MSSDRSLVESAAEMIRLFADQRKHGSAPEHNCPGMGSCVKCRMLRKADKLDDLAFRIGSADAELVVRIEELEGDLLLASGQLELARRAAEQHDDGLKELL
jgi:hypothetical protein